jgi:hypothetical protein
VGFENEPMDVNMPPVMAAKESGMRNLDLIRGCELLKVIGDFESKLKIWPWVRKEWQKERLQLIVKVGAMG